MIFFVSPPAAPLDWNVVLRAGLRHYGAPLAAPRSLPPGWTLELRNPPEPIAGLSAGRLYWLQAAGPGNQVVAARLLFWRDGERVRGQVLQANALPGEFSYGEGVVWGPGRKVGDRLVLTGCRYSMSPYAYGGIEVWRQVGPRWTLKVQKTTRQEVEDAGEFVGTGGSVRFVINEYPVLLAGSHGGPRLPVHATYGYRGGHFVRYDEFPIDIPLRAVDDLLVAAANENRRWGLRRGTASAWATARKVCRLDWRLDDERRRGRWSLRFTLKDRSSNDALRAEVVGIRGRYRVTRLHYFHPRPPSKSK